MKNKPLRHKEKNTFKFIPFSERISNVKIDVRQIKHKYEVESENTTYFYQTYEKWIVLNCSTSFSELIRDITPEIQILPQLLARKDDLVQVLQKHLNDKNPLNLQAALELVVALAKDLRQEFYPYFSSFYPLLVSLLSAKDSDQLEWAFQALASLFKYLWRYLINNLQTVFDSLLPLLDGSKPNYIRNFAAQGFAFVARKIKDGKKLVKLILKPLKENPHAIEGCSRLVFEVIRGVQGQFHSCAEKVLVGFISSFKDPANSHSLLCELLNGTLSHLVGHIHVKYSDLLWKILLDSVSELHGDCLKDKSERNVANLEQVLCMLQFTVEYKSSQLLSDVHTLTSLLMILLQPENQLGDHITDRISHILSYLLVSSSKLLTQELSSRIVIGAMGSLRGEHFINFIDRITHLSSFDGIVLPRLIKHCQSLEPLQVLPLFVKIILQKAHPAFDVNQFSSWAPYIINLNSVKAGESPVISDIYLELLLKKHQNSYLSSLDESISILLILPHLIPLDKDRVTSVMGKLIDEVCNDITRCTDEEKTSHKNKYLFLLSSALETLLYLSKKEPSYLLSINLENIFPILLGNIFEENVFIFRIIDFLISHDQLRTRMEPYFEKIKKILLPHLMSPYSKIRLYVTHILSELYKSEDPESVVSTLLQICCSSESVAASLFDYREKLKILQKLDPINESFGSTLVQNQSAGQIPLSYLLGVLYVNFKLLWDPISKLIISYGSVLKPAIFWIVFEEHIEKVINSIRTNREDAIVQNMFNSDFLNEMNSNLYNLNERADHFNHRILLLNLIKEIPEVYEAKSKDLVILFLSFLSEEYNKRYSEAATSCDIRLINDSSQLEDSQVASQGESMETDVDDEQEAPDETSQQEDLSESAQIEEMKKQLTSESSSPYWMPKLLTTTLLAHMGVFGKIRSPKSLYKEPELNKIFIEFLSSKVPDIQKGALDFLMTYKHKYLTPYRDHLYGLIDDKQFKNQLSLFRVDTESDLIKSEHRVDLIPVVLRLVYSKMHSKMVTGKETRQTRKATILRFLSGCSHEELASFFKMAFPLFIHHIEEDPLLMLDKLEKILHLEECIPPKRLESAVKLVDTILSYCGGLLLSQHIQFLTNITLLVGVHVKMVIEQRDQVNPPILRIIKNVRTLCYSVTAKFFDKYTNYEWSENEIKAIFKILITPSLKSLPFESVSSPTGQFKIFTIWSRYPKYFSLFDQRPEADGARTVLSSLMELWSSPKLHHSVHNAILDIVYHVFTTVDDPPPTSPEDNDMVVDETPLVVSKPQLEVPQKTENESSQGIRLVTPHIPTILEQLKRRLSTRRHLSPRELDILARVTGMVDDPASSEVLLSLLMPSLLKKAAGEDHVVMPLLQTSHNLITNLIQPGAYLRRLVPLYSRVVSAVARRLLFSIVIDLSKRKGFSTEELDTGLLEDLNAWHARWVDQPDYERRLGAFRMLEQIGDKETKISTTLAAIVIHTCFHFLKTESDLSLKDESRHCLRSLCPRVCLQYREDREELQFLLVQNIMPLIRRAISEPAREGTQSTRADGIRLLGTMARECESLHFVLTDLSPMTNKADLEVDFFENLLHLQLHRRVRAMLRLSEILDNMTKPPNSRTLMLYALPMISQYLLSEKYSDKNTIIDSAIKAVGSICKLLPWKDYHSVLRHFLNKLETEVDFNKQLVRIIVEVLNGFHFNLSQADPALLELRTSVPLAPAAAKKNTANSGNAEQATTLDPDCSATQEETAGEELAEEEDDYDEQEMTEEDKKTWRRGDVQLTRDSANRIVSTMRSELLPGLQGLLGQRTSEERAHKVNRKHAGDEEQHMVRVPLAIAIVKLLQRLPSRALLQTHLSGVVLQLCTLLKSRLESVRKSARETLVAILESLGPDYLPRILRDITPILQRGFHCHVLTYTIHALLSAMRDRYVSGQMNNCVHIILDVCSAELFGDLAEEKEVNQIVGRIKEARANRSFDIFHLMARYITEKYMLDIILPLKEELSRTLSHKNITKTSDCLQQVVLGLTENCFIEPESLLQFAYGVVSESIPSLVVSDRSTELNGPDRIKELIYQSRKNPDSYIIPEEPKNMMKAPQSRECAKTNSHILVEFGLKLFYFLLKREKLKYGDYKLHLDPTVKLLSDCIQSHHVKVSTLALKCFCWILRLDLPSVHANLPEISASFFKILHKYASAGLSKGDNFDLVMITFKAVSVLVREVRSYKPTPEQLRALILYCEQDLEDHSRQSTAFTLLKALVHRHVQSEELRQVMFKVARLSITAPLDSVRVQARQVILNFVMEYILGDDLIIFLAFYTKQLDYSTESGRESSFEMLRSFVSAFPSNVLHDQCYVIYVMVAPKLLEVRESDPGLRKKAAELLTLLLSKIDNNSKNKLFDITKEWLKDDKLAHRRLGAQLIGLMASCWTEGEDLTERLPECLNLMVEQLERGFEASTDPGRWVLLRKPPSEEEEGRLTTSHYLVYHLLAALFRILASVPPDKLLTLHSHQLEYVAECSQQLLGHDHEWVRVTAAQIVGLLLSRLGPARLGQLTSGQGLRSLVLDLVAQLKPGVGEAVLKQCGKLLILLADILKEQKEEPVQQDVEGEEEAKEQKVVSLSWMIRRLRQAVNKELVHAPHSTAVRSMVYDWTAGLALKLPGTALVGVAELLLGPLVREMSVEPQGGGEESASALSKQARTAANFLKKKIGSDLYRSLVADLTQRLQVKRAQRRAERSQLTVTDPERAAKRKINKQLKKKKLKKRKIELMKNDKFKRKYKKKDVDLQN